MAGTMRWGRLGGGQQRVPRKASLVAFVFMAATLVGVSSQAGAHDTGHHADHDTGIVAAVGKAPISSDGDVAGAPTDFLITFDTSLDPSVPGRTLLAGNTIKITLPNDFVNKSGIVANPGPPPDSCPPPAGTCSTAVLLQGWPQHPIPPTTASGNYTVGVEGTNTIVFTALKDLVPTPGEPGIKQAHLILRGFVNPEPGRYRFDVKAETGPGGAVETGVAVVRIRHSPRASINVTSVFNEGAPNTIYQHASAGADAPLAWDFLLWDHHGDPAVGVAIERVNHYHAHLVVGRRVVGEIYLDAPHHATGYGLASVGPSTLIEKGPVLNLPAGRLTAQFTAGDTSGRYTTTISMIDGNRIEMVVDVR